MTTKPKRPKRRRDFRAEYQRRVERGLKAGKSRAAARGHARAEDLGPVAPAPMDRNNPFEKALKAMKRGKSLRAAAAEFGVSPDRLRRHVKRHTTAQYQNGRWTIFDLRPQAVHIASGGQLKIIVVAVDDASEVGRYWVAVKHFLETNDVEFLRPFIGNGVRDIRERFYQFELRPNILRKLDSIGEFDFIEVYADTVH